MKFKINSLQQIILLLLTVGVGIFAINYTTATPPLDVRVSNLTNSYLSLSWTTEKPVKSCLFYSASKNKILRNIYFFLGISAKNCEDSPSNFHYLVLENLEPDTAYFYRISHNFRLFKNALPNLKTYPLSEKQPDSTNPVYGKITQDNLGVVNILVFLSQEKADNQLSTITNEQGNYIFDTSNFRDKTGNLLNLSKEDLVNLEADLPEKKIMRTIYLNQSQPAEMIEINE